ncbi:MAG: hypothetical protein GDA56_26525 [Hormoscilla sp. GM7CHS1pb]|nr:hypothetical protein [Hormoscilla sp. GM7CHS1pb]
MDINFAVIIGAFNAAKSIAEYFGLIESLGTSTIAMDGLFGMDGLLGIVFSERILMRASLSAISLAKKNKSSSSPSAAELLEKKENIKNIQQQAKEYAKSL